LRKHYDEVEIWYQEDKGHPAGEFVHSTGLKEVFHKKHYPDAQPPDVLFVRGDCTKYLPLLERMSGSTFLVYYSAGNYYCPPKKFWWHLIFVDDEKHISPVVQDTGVPTTLFKKSCVHKYFPARKGTGAVDVCFTCNAPQYRIKGGDHFQQIMRILRSDGITAYCIGLKSEELLRKFSRLDNVFFTGFIPRHYVGEIMARCKVAVVLSGDRDGSPRVLQEYLACDLPLVLSEGTAFSHNYLNTGTGVVASKHIEIAIMSVLERPSIYQPRKYFLENLTMDKAVEHFADAIRKQNGPIQ
jgi:glycosyltransferase involved in cell wall biosynthesis